MTRVQPERMEAGISRWALSLDTVWAVMAVALPVILIGGGLGALDLAYHVRLGDQMLATHRLVRADQLSFTAAGLPWQDQQWAAQVLLALAARPLGWLGLSFLRVILVGGTFLFVYLACRQSGARPRVAAYLTLASALVALTGLALRPQLFGAFLFALTSWIVAGRARHPERLPAVPLIVVAWANLHGSFVLGPLLVGLAWVQDRHRKDPGARRTLAVALVAGAAAAVNPFGPAIWLVVARLATNPAMGRLVTEWQPPTIRHWDDALFFASVAAVGGFLARRGRSTPWPTLLVLGVFLVMSLVATRNVLWWALAVPPTLAGLVPAPAERPAFPRSTLNTGIAAAVVLVMAGLLSLSAVTGPRRSPSENLRHAPLGITTALRGVLRPGDRIFNDQVWGSWFELALPENPIAVDSRIEVFPARVWQLYADVSAGRAGWQGVLDRWQVRAVAAGRDHQADLLPFLGRDPGWRLAYEDEDGSVYVRAESPL